MAAPACVGGLTDPTVVFGVLVEVAGERGHEVVIHDTDSNLNDTVGSKNFETTGNNIDQIVRRKRCEHSQRSVMQYCPRTLTISASENLSLLRRVGRW